MMRLLFLTICSLCLFSCSSKKTIYKGHGADSIPPEILQKYTPKAIDKNLRQKIQNYLDIRSGSTGHLSPDARSLYFNWLVTGSYQIWKLQGPKSFPLQMTAGEDTSALKEISADGRYLVIQRDQGGDEYPGIYLQPSQGGALIELFKKEKIKARFQFSSDDGKRFYYTSNEKSPTGTGLYRKTLGKDNAELLYFDEGTWSVADHIKNRWILLVKYRSNIATAYYLLDEKTKKLQPLFGQDELVDYSASFGKSEKELIVSTNREGEFKRLYRWKSGNFSKQALNPEKNMDVEYFYVEPSRRRILYVTNNRGYYTSSALSLNTGLPIKVPLFKKAVHSYFGSTTRNGRYTTLGVVSSNSPQSSYVLDWNTGKIKQWILPSSPEVDTSGFIPAELGEYPAKDGTKIPYFYRVPPACKKKLCSVIVDFHGGPEGQATPGFSPSTQLFLDEDFILMEPNVRGSSGYGKTWLDLDNGPKRLNVLGDIRDAAIHAKKHFAINGKNPKVGVMGGSYGGYSTFVAMTFYADHFDAGAAIVGMSSLVSFLQNTADYRRALREPEYGRLKEDREALEKLSPINQIDKIAAPLMIIHGATDPRVPAGEALQIQEELESRSVPSELLLFADEGHGIRKRSNRVLYYGHLIRFFKEHLQAKN